LLYYSIAITIVLSISLSEQFHLWFLPALSQFAHLPFSIPNHFHHFTNIFILYSWIYTSIYVSHERIILWRRLQCSQLLTDCWSKLIQNRWRFSCFVVLCFHLVFRIVLWSDEMVYNLYSLMNTLNMHFVSLLPLSLRWRYINPTFYILYFSSHSTSLFLSCHQLACCSFIRAVNHLFCYVSFSQFHFNVLIRKGI